MSPVVKPIPDGVNSLSAHLVVDDATAAIAFYQQAFGAVAGHCQKTPDGAKVLHAAVRIGNSTLMLVDEFPEWGSLGPKSIGGSPVTINLYVADADATFAKAVAAGAEVTMPLDDMFWGDRYGKLTDPFGHHWAIATHQRDVSGKELADAVAKFFS